MPYLRTPLLVVLLFTLCSRAVAGDSIKFDPAVELARVQAEQLVQFATKIEAKAGSWQWETRTQALQLAKKLYPGGKAAAEALQVKPAEAAAEEKAANKTAFDALQKQEKEREQAEGKLDSKAPVEIPVPDNLRGELDQLRYEMALEALTLAGELSTNPLGPAANLRTQLLTLAGDCLNPVRWRFQRALRDKIDAAKRAPFAPFQGTWKTEWGDLPLTQNSTAVTGNAGAVRIQGTFDPRELTLKGTYQNGQEVGSFEWKLARDERGFEGTFTNPRAQPPQAVAMKGAKIIAGAGK